MTADSFVQWPSGNSPTCVSQSIGLLETHLCHSPRDACLSSSPASRYGERSDLVMLFGILVSFMKQESPVKQISSLPLFHTCTGNYYTLHNFSGNSCYDAKFFEEPYKNQCSARSSDQFLGKKSFLTFFGDGKFQ